MSSFIGDSATIVYTFTEPENTGSFVLEVDNGQSTDTAVWVVERLPAEATATSRSPSFPNSRSLR